MTIFFCRVVSLFKGCASPQGVEGGRNGIPVWVWKFIIFNFNAVVCSNGTHLGMSLRIVSPAYRVKFLLLVVFLNYNVMFFWWLFIFSFL